MSDSPDWGYEPEHDEEGPDPATVAFLDQETEEFNQKVDQFAETFGFEHHCTCASDYTEGRLAETTVCFGNLCLDALETCKRLKEERDMLIKLLHGAIKESDGTDATEGVGGA